MRLKPGLMIAGAVALAIPTKGRAQIAQYNFANGGASGVTLTTMETATTTAANTSATLVSFGSATTVSQDEGAAASAYWASPGPDYFSVERASGTTTTDDTNYYVQFTVTAAAGYVLDPTSLSLVGGSGGGASSVGTAFGGTSSTGNLRSYYATDSNDGLPNATGGMTGTGSGPYDTNTGGTIVGDGTFSVWRSEPTLAAMNTPTINFPAGDVNLASFEVRVYFDTVTDLQNIDLGSLTLNGTVVPGAPVSQWTSSTSGDYNVSTNWNSGVPNAIGAQANFLGAFTSNHTVFTDIPITLGTLVFNNSVASYALTGAVGTSLTLQTASGSALVDVQAGTHEINLPLVLASNTTFQTDTSTASLVIGNPLTINSGVALTTTGSGKVIFNSIVNVGTNASFAINNSTQANALNMASGSTTTVGGTDTVLEVNSLSNLGTLNIEKNAVIVNYANSSDPFSSILSEISNGEITSTAAIPGYGVGLVDGNDNVSGTPVSSGQIEVAYTLQGDANLDGRVDATDFGIFAPNFGATGFTLGWEGGDFNYNGTVDATDFGLFAPNFGQSDSGMAVSLPSADYVALDAFAAANGLSLTSVPEPASWGLLALAGVCVLGRRRRPDDLCRSNILKDVLRS